ncbi:MAG: hypothetical protein AAF392_00755 [Bacteroidota bacterium]
MIVFSSGTCRKPSESLFNWSPQGNVYKSARNSSESAFNWSPQGNVYKSAVKIESDQPWLRDLGIDPYRQEAIIVNSSNATISFGGGGINGALQAYVASSERQKAWQDLVLPDGSSKS